MNSPPALSPPAWTDALARARQWSRRHGWRLGLALGSAVLAAVSWTLVAPPVYRSQALLRVGDWLPPVEAQPPPQRDDEPAAVAEQLLRSPQLAQPVARQLDLARDPDFVASARQAPASRGATSEDPLTERLLRRIRVSRSPGGNLIVLSAEDHHPAVAAALVNALVAELRRQMAAAQQRDVASGEAFLDGRIAQAHAAWRAAQDALLRFRLAHPAGAAGPELSAAMARLQALAEATTRAEIDLWRQQGDEAAGQPPGRAAATRAAGVQLSADEQRPWDQLRLRRADLAAEVSRLASQYGPAALPLVQARRALASVDESLARYGRLTIAGHGVSARSDLWQLRRLHAAIAQEQVRLAAGQRDSAQDNLLAAAADGQKALYENLWQQRQKMAVTAGLLRNPVQVLAPGRISLRPFRPRWSVNLAVGLLVGLLLGGALVAAADLRSVDCVGPATLAALRLPLLATLPAVAEPRHGAARKPPLLRVRLRVPLALPRRRSARAAPPAEFALPLGSAPWEMLPAALRHALDGLVVSLLLGAGENTAAVLLASPGPGEGKTTVALWMARALAESGSRVLLVDCHGASPALSWALAGHAGPGLAEYLAGECGTDSLLAAAVRADGAPALVPAGRPGGLCAAAFAGPALRRLIAEARRRFDWILLDAGALLSSPAACLLAAQADSTLLIAAAGRSRAAQLAQADQALRQAGASVLGAVLNSAAAPSAWSLPSFASTPSALPASAAPRRARAAAV